LRRRLGLSSSREVGQSIGLPAGDPEPEERMSTVAKVFVVLNLILAVAFLGAAAAFLGWDDWYRKRLDVALGEHGKVLTARDATITELRTNLSDTQRSLKDITDQKNALQGNYEATKTAYEQMRKSYDELNASATAATRALLVAQNTIKEGRTLTDQLMTERQKLTDEAKRFQEERDAAVKNQATADLNLEKTMTELKDLTAKLTQTETDLQRATFTLEQYKKRFPGGMPGPEQPMQTAKVLAADDSTNVVVISLGSEDGVKEGFRYTISRGNQYVGTIEITHVEAKQSAGRSQRDVQSRPIQKGDDAMTAH
jgi:hypothetical protein